MVDVPCITNILAMALLVHTKINAVVQSSQHTIYVYTHLLVAITPEVSPPSCPTTTGMRTQQTHLPANSSLKQRALTLFQKLYYISLFLVFLLYLYSIIHLSTPSNKRTISACGAVVSIPPSQPTNGSKAGVRSSNLRRRICVRTLFFGAGGLREDLDKENLSMICDRSIFFGSCWRCTSTIFGYEMR